MERGSVRRSSLKGGDRAIVNQTNVGAVPTAMLGKLLRDGVERIIMGFSERTLLSWAELNCVSRLVSLSLSLFSLAPPSPSPLFWLLA